MIIDKLNMDIMNIPCNIPAGATNHAVKTAYKLGHRDARHAAVEVVLEHNKASGSGCSVAAGAIRDQITADANCILHLLDTVDKLVGGASGAMPQAKTK
jgi:hypothetical protein